MKASWQGSTASHGKLYQRQNRYDFSFNYLFKINHAKRINILVVLQYKSNKELSKISSIFWWQLFHHFQLEQIHSTHTKHSSISFIHSSCTFFHSFIHFKLPWIISLSNLSNCLLGEGKRCFHSTNNNVLLLFSKDKSYEDIIFEKSFICTFLWITRKRRHFHPKFYLPPYWNLGSKMLYWSQKSITLAFYPAMFSTSVSHI